MLEIGENLLTFMGELFILAIVGGVLFYKYKVKKLQYKQ